MRVGWTALALGLAATACVAASAPKGCYDKTWSKGELKKLPLQMVTTIRVEAGIGAQPENKPASWGTLRARFRDTGDQWYSTAYECSDTGAGMACATICDGGIFVMASGRSGLQVIPQNGVILFSEDCAGTEAKLKLNEDRTPFAVGRISSRACPAR
jgi:hypothetical protein